MDLKIGFLLAGYYIVISMIFIFGNAVGIFEAGDGYNNTIALNDSSLSSEEIDEGGFFGTGVSFGRFFGWVGFGVGLPSDTPLFFSLLFIAWSTLMTILTIMWIINSIWSG